MGLIDYYEPDPPIECPKCGGQSGWQGYDAHAACFVWLQGVAAPMEQRVEIWSREGSSNEPHKRIHLLFIFALLIAGSGCDGPGRFRLRETNDLGKTGKETIIAETWQGSGFMENPVWKICLRQNGTNSRVLFTVESVFQESEPGYPRIILTDGVGVVQDSAKSYIFSLSTGQFITNAWPGDVYAGDFKPREQRFKSIRGTNNIVETERRK